MEAFGAWGFLASDGMTGEWGAPLRRGRARGTWNDGGNTDKKGMGAAGRSFQNLLKSKNFSQNARKID